MNVKIYRKLNAPLPNFTALENAMDPKDRATAEELKAKLKKASEEDDDAAFKAAQKQYDDFMDKIAAKQNVRVWRGNAKYAMDLYSAHQLGRNFAVEGKSESDIRRWCADNGYTADGLTAQRIIKAFKEQLSKG